VSQSTIAEKKAPSHDTRRALPRSVSFVVVALVFIAMSVAAAAPSPLLVVYQAEWGFPTGLLTLAFAIYAIALLVTLLVFGSLSDHIGRRPVMIAGLVMQLIALTMLLFASGIGIVIAARTVQGAATGISTGAFAASLTDLAPSGNKRVGTTIGSLAPLGGLAVGALVTGALIQFSGHASTEIFIALDIVFLLGLLAIALTRDSVTRRPGALRSLRPRAAVPAAARREFAAAVPVLIGTWALAGFYLGLSAEALQEIFKIDGGLIDGTAVAIATGAGALTVYAAQKVAPRISAFVGTAAVTLGMLATLIAVAAHNLPLFIIGDAIGGIGIGAAFAGTMALVIPHARAHERAEVFASIYIVSYLAFGLPAIIAGLLITPFGLLPVTIGYASFDVAVAATGLGTHLIRRGNPRREIPLSPRNMSGAR
jgi:MFS family permease